MKRFAKTVLLVIAASLLFCSCSFNYSVESLLSPPKLTEEQTAIYQALQNSKGGNISLKYPKSGDYRSAFIIRNIDDEPTDEALVFYRSTTGTGTDSSSYLRLNFLDQQDGSWVSVYDMPATGTDVEKVVFQTLGDSDKLNIIIGYSVLNQTEKGVSVLTYENRVPVEEYKSSYTVMDFLDLDADGNTELFLITADRTIPASTAYLVGWRKDTFGILRSVSLDSSATEYTNVRAGKLDADTTALFIEHSNGDSTYGTDVLYCVANNLVNCIFSEAAAANSKKVLRRVNAYTANVVSRDIDDDGIFEVAGTSVLPSYTNLTKPEQINATIWYSVSKDFTMTKKYYTYYSTNNDFVFFFPNRWQELVTVTLSADGSELYFWTATDSVSTLSELLLSIKTVPVSQADNRALATDSWKRFEQTENSAYAYYVRQGDINGQMTLTNDELYDSLKFLPVS